jgi:excisionase family DNA binding protein
MSINKRLLTTKEAATYLNLSVAALVRYRWAGKGPAYIKLGDGRSIRYRLEDLEAWINRGRFDPERVDAR